MLSSATHIATKSSFNSLFAGGSSETSGEAHPALPTMTSACTAAAPPLYITCGTALASSDADHDHMANNICVITQEPTIELAMSARMQPDVAPTMDMLVPQQTELADNELRGSSLSAKTNFLYAARLATVTAQNVPSSRARQPKSRAATMGKAMPSQPVEPEAKKVTIRYVRLIPASAAPKMATVTTLPTSSSKTSVDIQDQTKAA